MPNVIIRRAPSEIDISMAIFETLETRTVARLTGEANVCFSGVRACPIAIA